MSSNIRPLHGPSDLYLQASTRFMARDLERSGLVPEDLPGGTPDATKAAAQSNESLVASYTIPYFSVQGKLLPQMYQRRLLYNLSPSAMKRAKLGKYTQPPRAVLGELSTIPYMPPCAQGSGEEFIICEGAKKLLASTKRFGLPGLAISGCANWHHPTEDLPIHPAILERIQWMGGRVCYIIPDGDVTKPFIGGEYRGLEEALRRTVPGIEIHVRLPPEHKGIDDYLVEHPDYTVADFRSEEDVRLADFVMSQGELIARYDLMTTGEELTQRIITNEENIYTLYDAHPWFKGQIRYNAESMAVEYRGSEMRMDSVLKKATRDLQRNMFMPRVAVERVRACMGTVAHENSYSPLQEYYEGLAGRWDGVERLGRVFGAWCGAEDSEYRYWVAYAIIGGHVKRVLEPGFNGYRSLVILWGPQYTGKTGWCGWLAGGAEYVYDLNVGALRHGDKDTMLGMIKNRVVRLDDVDSLGRYENAELKRFITQSTFQVREPYGRAVEEYKARHVIVATSNERETVPMDGANTRFLPVHIPAMFDFKKLYKYREQLLAECASMLERGEDIFVDPRGYPEEWESNIHRPAYWDELVGVADVVRGMAPPEQLKNALHGEFYVLTMRDIVKYIGLPESTIMNVNTMREIGKCMRALGWERRDANTKPCAIRTKDRKYINGFYLKK